MDILIRDVKEEVVEALDRLARETGMSRSSYIRARLTDAAQAGRLPARFGEGYRAFASGGGKATLKRGGPGDRVQRGARKLSQEEFDAFQRACMVADPRNGGDWLEARRILEAAGFEVFHI